MDSITVVWNTAEKYQECDPLIHDQIEQIRDFTDSANFCNRAWTEAEGANFIHIELIETGTNYLWSRWSIGAEYIRTESMLVMDDDKRFSDQYLLCLFAEWKQSNEPGQPPKVLVQEPRSFVQISQEKSEEMRGQLMANPDHYKPIPPDGQYTFKYSYDWSVQDEEWSMGLPSGSVVPTEILLSIDDIFNEFDLKPIIENQEALCDDVAFSLSVSHIFQRKWPGRKPFVLHDPKGRVPRRVRAEDTHDAFDFRGETPCNHGQGVSSHGLKNLFRTECLNLMVSKFDLDPVVIHTRTDDMVECACGDCAA